MIHVIEKFKNNDDILKIIHGNDLVALNDYVKPEVDAWNADREAFFVHDGIKQEFYTFCGNPMYKRAFSLERSFKCNGLYVYSWESPCSSMKPGHMVRHINSENQATLHLILSTSRMAEKSSYESDDATGFSMCLINPYTLGVGVGGKDRPTGRQITFI